MSTIVEDIITSAKALIATELPDYMQLHYEYDLESNDFKSKRKRYGFIPEESDFDFIGGTKKHVTLDHVFQLILTNDFTNSRNDEAQRAAINTLYETLNTLFAKIIHNKLGNPSVLNVQLRDTLPPEFIDENTIAVLRANFVVKYRYVLT